MTEQVIDYTAAHDTLQSDSKRANCECTEAQSVDKRTCLQAIEMSEPGVPIKTCSTKKRCQYNRMWWNDYLTLLWNDYCDAQQLYSQAHGLSKQRLKAVMKIKENDFDREVQRAKRAFWRKQQQSVLFLRQLMAREEERQYCVNVGHIYVSEQHNVMVPLEVCVYSHRYVSRSSLLERWVLDYDMLFNHNGDFNAEPKNCSTQSNSLSESNNDRILCGCDSSCSNTNTLDKQSKDKYIENNDIINETDTSNTCSEEDSLSCSSKTSTVSDSSPDKSAVSDNSKRSLCNSSPSGKKVAPVTHGDRPNKSVLLNYHCDVNITEALVQEMQNEDKGEPRGMLRAEMKSKAEVYI